MPIPDPLAELAGALGRAVASTTPVGGGCITDTRRVALDDGTVVFAKLDRHAPEAFFASEAAGLHWLPCCRQCEYNRTAYSAVFNLFSPLVLLCDRDIFICRAVTAAPG